MNLIVKDHTKFSAFDYANGQQADENPYILGQIVVRKVEYAGEYAEIGVVIQIHDSAEMRVDMWGNCSVNEVAPATLEMVMLLRADLLPAIDFTNGVQVAFQFTPVPPSDSLPPYPVKCDAVTVNGGRIRNLLCSVTMSEEYVDLLNTVGEFGPNIPGWREQDTLYVPLRRLVAMREETFAPFVTAALNEIIPLPF